MALQIFAKRDRHTFESWLTATPWGQLFQQYASGTVSGLPKQPTFVLSDEPMRLLLARGELARQGRDNEYMFVETHSLENLDYHRFQLKKYGSRWPVDLAHQEFYSSALIEWLTQISLISDNNIIFNLVDGIIRICVFLVYIWTISRMSDIQRVFQYHGAEHKSIFAFEAGDELTVANVRKYSCLHPRCGTSFLLIVMLVSIVIFSLIPKLWPFFMKAGARVVFLPLIAGVSYELLKWSAKNDHSRLVRMVIAPGLALQRLTTREPDDSQIEVAIRSMEEALAVNAGYKDDRLVI
jgi:hypothetical protein